MITSNLMWTRWKEHFKFSPGLIHPCSQINKPLPPASKHCACTWPKELTWRTGSLWHLMFVSPIKRWTPFTVSSCGMKQTLKVSLPMLCLQYYFMDIVESVCIMLRTPLGEERDVVVTSHSPSHCHWTKTLNKSWAKALFGRSESLENGQNPKSSVCAQDTGTRVPPGTQRCAGTLNHSDQL